MRPWRLVLLGLLAAAAAATVVYWSWIDAQRRAVIVLSGTSPTPVLSWAVRLSTGTPRMEEALLGGAQTTVVLPGRGSRWPAVVLYPGVSDGGRANPSVERVARALARAGFLVAVPDLPGAADGEIVGATLTSAVQAALDTIGRDDVAGGRVALAGAWTGGALAILAAEDPRLAPRVSVVAAVSPWAAGANLLRLATTGFVLDGGQLKPFRTDPYLSLVAARTLVAALGPGPDGDRLQRLLGAVARTDQNPLRVVQGLALAGLSPDAAAVVRLLENTHAPSFDMLYAQLPAAVRFQIEELSPLVGASRLQARVEIAAAAHDRFVPPEEARALGRSSPRVHVTVTGAVRGGLPDPSFTQAFGTDVFLVRVLHAAR